MIIPMHMFVLFSCVFLSPLNAMQHYPALSNQADNHADFTTKQRAQRELKLQNLLEARQDRSSERDQAKQNNQLYYGTMHIFVIPLRRIPMSSNNALT